MRLHPSGVRVSLRWGITQTLDKLQLTLWSYTDNTTRFAFSMFVVQERMVKSKHLQVVGCRRYEYRMRTCACINVVFLLYGINYFKTPFVRVLVACFVHLCTVVRVYARHLLIRCFTPACFCRHAHISIGSVCRCLGWICTSTGSAPTSGTSAISF